MSTTTEPDQAEAGAASATSMHGRPPGCGQFGSGMRSQRTSGRSSSAVTDPPVIRSMSGHLPFGTCLSPRSHSLTVGCLTPSFSASDVCVPQTSIALSIGFMPRNIGIADATVNCIACYRLCLLEFRNAFRN